MFKVANFKHSMLEAVRGKLQRFLHILDEKVAQQAAAGVADGAVGPSAKREEKGDDEDDGGGERAALTDSAS